MSAFEWIYQIVVEGLKYVVLGHWFFGYEFNRKKTRYLLVLYPLIIPVVEMLGEYMGISKGIYVYRKSWGVLLLLFLLQGKILEKIKLFFFIWFLVDLVDVTIATPFYVFSIIEEHDVNIKMCIGCISDVLWICLGWKLKKIQKEMKNFWQELSFHEYIFLLLMVFLASSLMGGFQGYFYGAITISERQIVFVFELIAVVGFTITCVWLFHTRQMKKRLEEINRLNVSYMALQKKYYEESLIQYEDMRSFRHDINKHIYVLSGLSKEDRVDELKEYISEMASSYEKVRTIHTGNFIADCLISHTMEVMEEKGGFQFDLEGYFSENVFMDDLDFCVLLSNLLENAREALEKVEGERLLCIEIKRHCEFIFLNFSNSVSEENIDFTHTSKKDAVNHGYGTQNIRRVVEKYNGTVQWKQEYGMAVVNIKFGHMEATK